MVADIASERLHWGRGACGILAVVLPTVLLVQLAISLLILHPSSANVSDVATALDTSSASLLACNAGAADKERSTDETYTRWLVSQGGFLGGEVCRPYGLQRGVCATRNYEGMCAALRNSAA